MSRSDDTLRTIAFYLPQFHHVPQNDQWWGPGFTEWTNVQKARPLFPGHLQPQVPADLGYYDLLDPTVRQAQASLARRYAISAFCYYHYWFHGERLLERPVHEMLRSRTPDLPFCLCWANEPWTRVWDGGSGEVLQPQRYSAEDDVRHIEWLLEAFADPRYVRVEGKPLFLVYRASALPDPRRTTDLWRDRVRRAGFPDLYLCRVESYDGTGDPRPLGFDAGVEFFPGGRLKLLLGGGPWQQRLRTVYLNALGREAGPRRIPYDCLVRTVLDRPDPGYPRFPCVVPDWDNTPRRPWAPLIVTGSTPEKFGRWVSEAVARLEDRPPSQQLLFVNAWNEWGEGCHLEPCQRWGHGYLEAFARATARETAR